MPRRRARSDDDEPIAVLERMVHEALDVAKKARRHRKSLAGDNFYGNKLANLRADAANAFRDLSSQSAGDVSAMAEMIQTVFSAATPDAERIAAARELSFALRTTWRPNASPQPSSGSDTLFPLGLLGQANRGYLTTVGRQMNGCFAAGWYDACAVMMRRLVEIAIIEAFEHRGIADRIKDSNGNYFQLTELVGTAMGEQSWSLSRNTRKYLPQLRDIGHRSAHGRYYHAQREDVERVQQGFRVVVEEFLHHAALL